LGIWLVRRPGVSKPGLSRQLRRGHVDGYDRHRSHAWQLPFLRYRGDGACTAVSGFALAAIVGMLRNGPEGHKPRRATKTPVQALVACAPGRTLIPLALFVPRRDRPLLRRLALPAAAVLTVPLKFLLCSGCWPGNSSNNQLGLRPWLGDSLGWFVRHLAAVTSCGSPGCCWRSSLESCCAVFADGCRGGDTVVVRSGLVVEEM